VGTLVHGTWELVAEARGSEVKLRNESVLRYAVPANVWKNGLSIAEWVEKTFVAVND
jgi:hypothetical protein